MLETPPPTQPAVESSPRGPLDEAPDKFGLYREAVTPQLRAARLESVGLAIFVGMVARNFGHDMNRADLLKMRAAAREAAEVWCEGKDGA